MSIILTVLYNYNERKGVNEKKPINREYQKERMYEITSEKDLNKATANDN
jgi:hypothetical protein